jgi:hypothetical protein
MALLCWSCFGSAYSLSQTLLNQRNQRTFPPAEQYPPFLRSPPPLITSIAIASQAGDASPPDQRRPSLRLRRRRHRRRRASYPPGTPPLPGSPSIPAVWLSVLASQQLRRFVCLFYLAISTTHPIDWLELWHVVTGISRQALQATAMAVYQRSKRAAGN